MGASDNDWNQTPKHSPDPTIPYPTLIIRAGEIIQIFFWRNQPTNDFFHGPPKPNQFHSNVGPPPFQQTLPQPPLQPLALPPTPSFEDKMLNAMATISQSVGEIKTTIHVHSQSIATLEAQMVQLPETVSRRPEGTLPSQPTLNPKGKEIRSTFHQFEHVKSIMTVRSGKVVEKPNLEENPSPIAIPNPPPKDQPPTIKVESQEDPPVEEPHPSPKSTKLDDLGFPIDEFVPNTFTTKSPISNGT